MPNKLARKVIQRVVDFAVCRYTLFGFYLGKFVRILLLHVYIICAMHIFVNVHCTFW